MDTPEQIAEAFRANLVGVRKLIDFDRDVLDLTIKQIADLHDRLKKHQHIDNPDLNGGKILQFVSNIRIHDSLRTRYQTIFNQAIVLLVSYFASALGDIFRYGLSVRMERDDGGKLLDEELKLTIGELRERDWDLKDSAPDLLIAKRDLSFQDMGAIHRAFDQYLNVSLVQDRRVNNIILTQACRHVIVHAGAAISGRLVKQVSKAVPRDLKPDLRVGEAVQFTPEEVIDACENMLGYIDDLAQKVRSTLETAA
jgi:hypothetical protein